ncbi:hypothetical protein C2G38_2168576 [Gigaspora rosea]|uniref:F-box domain-containing protein n=1 Tax=Gigaspora rosea TaxID=44941 RepID=A0A397VPK7_9GLOM|nr:hypothetical protein C2G38_2168576 [Gigaspora rosea]
MNQFLLETNINIFKMLNFKEQLKLRLVSKYFKIVFETIWSNNICQYYFTKKPIFIFCYGKTGSGKSSLEKKLFKSFSYCWGPYDNKIKNYLKNQNQQVFPKMLCNQIITKRYFNKYKEINFVYLEIENIEENNKWPEVIQNFDLNCGYEEGDSTSFSNNQQSSSMINEEESFLVITDEENQSLTEIKKLTYISPKFKNRGVVEDMILDLVSDKIKIGNIPLIEVCILDNKIHSSDNCRLYTIQSAIKLGAKIKKCLFELLERRIVI